MIDLLFEPAPSWLVIALVVIIILSFKTKIDLIALRSNIVAAVSTVWLATKRFSE
tara:strand:- start:639 stop:803 length:165 start_codon:yes stop_codon:yes gene_type:complete